MRESCPRAAEARVKLPREHVPSAWNQARLPVLADRRTHGPHAVGNVVQAQVPEHVAVDERVRFDRDDERIRVALRQRDRLLAVVGSQV